MSQPLHRDFTPSKSFKLQLIISSTVYINSNHLWLSKSKTFRETSDTWNIFVASSCLNSKRRVLWQFHSIPNFSLTWNHQHPTCKHHLLKLSPFLWWINEHHFGFREQLFSPWYSGANSLNPIHLNLGCPSTRSRILLTLAYSCFPYNKFSSTIARRARTRSLVLFAKISPGLAVLV